MGVNTKVAVNQLSMVTRFHKINVMFIALHTADQA